MVMRPLTVLEAQFTKEVISVPYDGDGASRDYDVHYRDLWDLATDLLRNPRLFPYFSFDAHRFSKFDGATFVRFVDEPFTAQDIWDIQVCNTQFGHVFISLYFCSRNSH